jgi:hypothetical protein
MPDTRTVTELFGARRPELQDERAPLGVEVGEEEADLLDVTAQGARTARYSPSEAAITTVTTGPPGAYEGRLRSLRPAETASFADALGITPAIVVGRLQHEGLIQLSESKKWKRQLHFVQN